MAEPKPAGDAVEHSLEFHLSDYAPTPTIAAALRREAGRRGTPLFAYDAERLVADASAISSAFPDPEWTRLYSLKANALPGLVARIAELGFGANGVSRGELALAERAGVPSTRSALEGIGKTPADLRRAVDLAEAERPLLWVSIESVDEARDLMTLARKLSRGRRVDALLRLNPGVDPQTHAGLAVGRPDSKFGLAASELEAAAKALGAGGGPVRIRGVHAHVGSQMTSPRDWTAGMAAALRVFDELARLSPDADTLDAGGGFPAGVPGASPLGEFAAGARDALARIDPRRRPSRLAIEPGRAVVAGSGWLVGRVLHVRERSGLKVIVDAGMTELPRPALYGARHPAFALTSKGRPVDAAQASLEVTLEGPICESTDRIGPATLPPMARGDLIAVGVAGAYASVMASTYNGRPRPAEVMIEADGTASLLRRRGSFASLP
jgi:diaminopimelate decarboxylase